MCGIAGCVNLKGDVINSLEERLTFMNKIQESNKAKSAVA